MSIDVSLLARICEAPGAPGFEKEIRNLVITELKGLADDVRVNNMGSVIALKKGRSSAKKTMAAAHMDEIGFIVTHVDEDARKRALALIEEAGEREARVLAADGGLVIGFSPAAAMRKRWPRSRVAWNWPRP